jgi:tRNA uridine 5-carboxymethylaminomethyl modification enzyme
VRVAPAEFNSVMGEKATEPLREHETYHQVLKRPDTTLADLLLMERARADERMQILGSDRAAREQLEIEVKYEGYLKRQQEQVAQYQRNEQMPIPPDFDFSRMRSLSNEGKEKLQKVRPRSIGQASRISGVTPADISVLMVTLLR